MPIASHEFQIGVRCTLVNSTGVPITKDEILDLLYESRTSLFIRECQPPVATADALVARERDGDNEIEDVPIRSTSDPEDNLFKIPSIEKPDAPNQPEPIDGSMDHAPVSTDY